MQGPGRHLRQWGVPQVPAPKLRERGVVGAQGGGQHRGGGRGDQGPARAGGPGEEAAELEAGQGVWGDRLVHAQPGPGDPRVVYV
jgi:hypothetical protein